MKMVQVFLLVVLINGGFFVHSSPVGDPKEDKKSTYAKLRIVNYTITQRLHQLLDTIKLPVDDMRVPRSLSGLPGTALTLGAIDLAINALGGEVAPTKDEHYDAVVIESDPDDEGLAIGFIDFIITALGGEGELPKKKNKVKKKIKPLKKLTNPKRNEIDRKALIMAVVLALKQAAPKKTIPNKVPVKTGNNFQGPFFEELKKDNNEIVGTRQAISINVANGGSGGGGGGSGAESGGNGGSGGGGGGGGGGGNGGNGGSGSGGNGGGGSSGSGGGGSEGNGGGDDGEGNDSGESGGMESDGDEGGSEGSTDSLVMAIMDVIEEYVETNEDSELSEGDLIVLVVTEIKDYYEENSDTSSSGKVILEVVKTVHQKYAVETFAYSVGSVMVKTVETINEEVNKASDMSETDVAEAMQNVVTKINEIYKESSSSSKVEVANLIVSVIEVIVEDIGKTEIISNILVTIASDIGKAFYDVDEENIGALIYLTLNTIHAVLKSSDVSALIKKGDLMLEVARAIKENSMSGLQSSSDVDTLLIAVLTAINDNLGEDKRISRSLMLFSVAVTTEKVTSASLTQTEISRSTQLISLVFQEIHKVIMETSVSSAVDVGSLMVKVATKIKESYENMLSSSSDIDMMAIAVMEAAEEMLSEEKVITRSKFHSSVVKSIYEGSMSSDAVDSKSTLIISRVLSITASIMELSRVSSDVKVGMLFISLAKKVNELFSAGVASTFEVDNLIISVLETFNLELAADKSISRVTILSAVANKIYASTTSLVEDSNMTKSSLVIVKTLAAMAIEIINSKTDAMVDTGNVMVEAAKNIQEAYASTSHVESSTLIVSVIETVNTELENDESVERGNVIVKLVEIIAENVEMVSEKDDIKSKVIKMILDIINDGKKNSATKSETGNVMVAVAKKIQEFYSADISYADFILMILETLEIELMDSKSEKGTLAFSIVEEVSKVINSGADSESSIIKVTLVVLNLITSEFKKTTKTDLDVITIMQGAVTEIGEVFDAGADEENTAINIVNSVIQSIENDMEEDDIINRANIYALIAETIKILYASSNSSSAVNWLDMYSSSATSVGEEYTKVSMSSKKEAGSMIAKFLEVINTEYGSSTDIATYDSGNLISSIIDETVTILENNSMSSSSSLNSGLLLSNVATGITEAYTRATSYSDSGRLIAAAIISLNKDITDSESSSMKVVQSDLFSKVSAAILEKYEMADDNSEVTAGAVSVRAVDAINEQLGADVAKSTETVSLYVNVLKTINEEFVDIITFSDDGKKEIKAMIAAVEVFDGSLPNSIDPGEIIFTTITSIHELYDPEDTRLNGPQQFIDGILQSIADFFHGNSRKKGKFKYIKKNVSKALKKVLL